VLDVSPNGRLALWFGFAGLLAPAIVFFIDMTLRGSPSRLPFYASSTFINCMSAVSYAFMACGLGYVDNEGRAIYVVRGVDWLLTSPFLLWELCLLSGCSPAQTLKLIILDVLMTVSGTFGGIVPRGAMSWCMWSVAMAFFVPLIWDIVTKLHDSAAKKAGPDALETFHELAFLTVGMWCLRPLVWVLTTGLDWMSPDIEAILYALLDIMTKSGFGMLLVFSHDAMDQASWVAQEGRVLLRDFSASRSE